MKDLYGRVCDGIYEMKAADKKPAFLIVDETTFEEMKTEYEDVVTQHPLRPTATGYSYMSLVVAVVAGTGENIRIVTVV